MTTKALLGWIVLAGVLGFATVTVFQTHKEQKAFVSAINARMEEAFNKLYPDPTLSYLGTKSPDYAKAVTVWKELKVAFMSGEENFFRPGRIATPYELSDVATRGRWERFEAVCKVKPQKGCLEY